MAISQAYWIGTAFGNRYLVTAAHDDLEERTLTYSDNFGRVALVQQNSGNSPATYAWYSDTAYTYDTHDRLKVIGNMGETTTINYNYLCQKTSMVDPDMGSWTYDYYPSPAHCGRRPMRAVMCFGMDWVITTTYPSGEVVTQAYSSTRALASLTSTIYSANIASGISYDEAGRMRTLSLVG